MSDQKPMSFLRKWGPLVVLSLALAIIIIDTTVLNVSLAAIIKDLNSNVQEMQWIISIYSLVLAALTIVGGRLGDLLGRKKMFVVGAIIFAIGSFIASISSSVTMLLFGWSIIEGIGAALMMPATASLLVANYKDRDRAIAFGVWGGIAAAASAFGPILGGYLTTNVSWHWAFRINVFVVAILVISSFIITESIDKKERHVLDIIGVVLSSLGLVSIVYGIIEASTYGWFTAKKAWDVFGQTINFNGISVVPIAIVFGFILLILFALWENYVEKKGNTPLVSLNLFKNRQFSSGIITTTIMSLGQAGIIFVVPVFLQAVLGLDAFNTGIALLPLSFSLLIAAPLSAVLSKNITPKRLIQAGLLLNLVALGVLYASISVNATAWTLAPGLIIYGAGMGLVMAQISNMTLSAVELYQAGEASGVNATMRQIGSTLGSAIIGTIFISTLVTSFGTGITNSTVIPNAFKTAIVDKINSLGSSVEFSGVDAVANNIPPVIKTELGALSHQATVDGNKDALVYTAMFTVLSIGSSVFLPNIKKLDRASQGPAAAH